MPKPTKLTTPSEYKKAFLKEFETAKYRHDRHKIWNDFLDYVIIMSSLSLNRQQKLQELAVIEREYDKEEQESFVRMLMYLTGAMDETFHDFLGEFYMNHVSVNQHGQFFTPPEINLLIAKMMVGDNEMEGKSICDPCCGSAGMLLKLAEIAGRKNHFFGADVDRTCVKMAVINMTLYSVPGVVLWMNTLTLEIFGGWEITLFGYPKIPYLRKLNDEELKSKVVEKVATEISKAKPEKTNVPVQLNLFNI